MSDTHVLAGCLGVTVARSGHSCPPTEPAGCPRPQVSLAVAVKAAAGAILSEGLSRWTCPWPGCPPPVAVLTVWASQSPRLSILFFFF